jgi:hypothetical protein
MLEENANGIIPRGKSSRTAVSAPAIPAKAKIRRVAPIVLRFLLFSVVPEFRER